MKWTEADYDDADAPEAGVASAIALVLVTMAVVAIWLVLAGR